jgi:hypothetical protein
MNSPYLLTALATGPEAVGLALAQVPSDRIDEALSDDRFSPREAIAHLADVESIMRARMKQAVDHPSSTIVSFHVLGSFSVSEQAHQMVCHDLYHVDHLLVYR